MRSAPGKTCPSCAERYDADVLFCPRDGTPLASSRSPSFQTTDRDSYLGVELAGQIRLKHLIGIGSMGRVYRAFQAGIDRDVAVKVLHRELSGNGELVQRFHREAKVASRLIHPNVVQVLMTGALPSNTDPRIGGELYLVMEHLDGISLLSALAAAGTDGEGQALSLARALHIALQICDAVGEAHAQGIVHRDLKPENVMLVRRGDDPDYVKVLDFGIARLDWADRSSMATQAGLIFGTAKYISPEGAEGLPVAPPADVYSIATILYQCLAGRTPFEGDSPVALLVQHTHAPPPELRTIARASYVPAPLAAVIMQNLAKKPSDRSPNARVMGRELVAAARASGLVPEEIAAQSTCFSPSGFGPVKLASKERTKALELSADLASRIGGVPAPRRGEEARADATPTPSVGPSGTLIGDTDVRTSEPPRVSTTENGSRSNTGPDGLGKPNLGPPSGSKPPVLRAASSAAPASSPPRRSSEGARGPVTTPPTPELDFEDEDDGALNPPPAPSSTMQGTETTLEARGVPRRRFTRLAALVAGVLIATPMVILGGRHFGAWGSASGSESLEAMLEEARECMNHHSWDAPPQHNLKELTDAALARMPGDPRILGLRREAAERLLSDALGRKYGSDLPEAIHLARLALALNPELTTAQHLVADLESTKEPEVAPMTSASADHGGKNTKKPAGRDIKGPSTAVPSGAILPPSPAPVSSDRPPSPAPSSTGPWL